VDALAQIGQFEFERHSLLAPLEAASFVLRRKGDGGDADEI